VAGKTYIRLRGEFVYLAVVVDAFSRKAAVRELERAIMLRQPAPGLVHISDRGIQ